MNNFLVVIGVSKYKEALIPSIYGVTTDIARIKDYFRLWGMNDENILVVEDSSATRQGILDSIRVELLRRVSSPNSVIVYYAGHGKHVTESVLDDKYALLCYDSKLADIAGTSLTVKELIQGAYRSNPQKLYVFIDACEVGIPSLSDSLIKKISTEEDRCLCVIAATRGSDTFDTISGGRFTTSVLKAFATLRNEPHPSCSDLIRVIERCAENDGVSAPQVMRLGTESTWYLEGLQPLYKCKLNNTEYIKRADSITKITDTLLINTERNCFNVYGIAKSGKTLIALQMHQHFDSFVYCNIDLHSNIEQIQSNISRAAAEKLISTGRMPTFGYEISIDILLGYIIEERIQLHIILDHAERLSRKEFDLLVIKLTSSGCIKIVAFSKAPLQTDSYDIVIIPCPEFSKKEYEKLVQNYSSQKQYDIFVKRYELFSSKPQELIQSLKHENSGSKNKEVCISYVCKTNGFVDDKFFATIFHVPLAPIAELIDIGLVLVREDCYIPHETLYEEYSIEKGSFYTSREAEQYWETQALATPTNDYACRQVQILINKKGILWIKKPEQLLRVLVISDIRQCDWNNIENLIPYLILHKLTDMIIAAGTALAHVARSKMFENDQSIRTILSPSEMTQWNIICAEVDYWKGDFVQSIDKSVEMINSPHLSNNMYQHACLNISVAYFFLGEWDKSKTYLRNITDCSGRLFGWKNMILGTILAIRGENFESGTNMLNDSINILIAVKDYAGVGIAYGNIGECYIKNAQYTTAKKYLSEGKKYTLLTHDDATRLEIIRNELLASIYSKGVYDAEARRLEEQINELLKEVNDKTELMQVYNTLAISAAYNYQADLSEKFYQEAFKITSGNREYDIYTNLSCSILNIVRGKITDFEQSIQKLYDLAQKGDNIFAIKQCIKTVNDIVNIYNLSKPQTKTFIEMEQMYG